MRSGLAHLSRKGPKAAQAVNRPLRLADDASPGLKQHTDEDIKQLVGGVRDFGVEGFN